MRVYELARELEVSNKDLVAQLQDLGVAVKSHSNSITESDADLVRRERNNTDTAVDAKVNESEPDNPEALEEPVQETPAPEPIEPLADASPPELEKKVLSIKGPIVVREFAEMLGLKPNFLIAELMKMNVFASINEKIDIKIGQQLAEAHGFVIEREKRQPERKPPLPKKKEKLAESEIDEPENMKERPPIITFMGHVDHGKTSILDAIRKTKVAEDEDGGITQHIGAYTVTRDGRSITFLDTPGHAAFTAMRSRGANLTDIAIIVVAADDGIMPQTREAIQHAKAAEVTIMVAINKIDLPQANPDRVKQQFHEEGVTVEDWGGDVVACEVSATTGQGIESLLEYINLQAELLQLQANPKGKTEGFVIEAQLEPDMGPTAHLLVRRGTLSVGHTIVCGSHWAKIKALVNDQGKKIQKAGPSIPAKCLGLSGVPEAGASFEVVADPKTAKSVVEGRIQANKGESQQAPNRNTSLEDLLSATAPGETLELPAIIKADVQGSVEALQLALQEISSEKISLKFVATSVGNITANDVLLASASNAIILGFHVTVENDAVSFAKKEGVEIRLYNIIYELVDEVREAMAGLLAPEERESTMGEAEIRQVFELSNRSRVAGCMITNGRVRSRSRARIRRNNTVIYDGRLSTLRRFQNDANEVRVGQECGIRFENFVRFEVGDVIEIYKVDKVDAKL